MKCKIKDVTAMIMSLI